LSNGPFRNEQSIFEKFALQPTAAATTVALVHLFHAISELLDTNQLVIIYALDFSKAFDSAVLDEYLHLEM
jgi:hypothetical protein